MDDIESGLCLYGMYTAIPVGLITASVVMTWIVTWDCRYLKTTELLESDDNSTHTYTLGPWTVEEWFFTGSQFETRWCTIWAYHKNLGVEDIDAPIVYTRAATMFTSLFSILLAMVVWLLIVMTMPPPLNQLLACLNLFCGVLMILTLVMLASDNFCQDAESCELDNDGIIAIVTAACFMLTGVSLMLLPTPREGRRVNNKQKEPQQQQPATTTTVKETKITEEIEEIVDEETGTTTIVTKRTTIFPDGSREVHERKETKPTPNAKPTKTTVTTSTTTPAPAPKETATVVKEDAAE